MDDDVDTCMPRPDYDRLVASASELPDVYRLVDPRDFGSPLQFVAFLDERIRAEEGNGSGIRRECLWVDVFPVDGVPAGALARSVRFLRLRWLLARRAWPVLDLRLSNAWKG